MPNSARVKMTPALPEGDPGSLVGPWECPVWALSSELHIAVENSFDSTAVCQYFIWVLLPVFGTCRLSKFTMAGPQIWTSTKTVNLCISTFGSRWISVRASRNAFSSLPSFSYPWHLLNNAFESFGKIFNAIKKKNIQINNCLIITEVLTVSLILMYLYKNLPVK